MSKTVCPTSSVKNWSPCFRTGRESLVDDPRLGQANSHHNRSHRQDGRLSEKWLPCHIANVGGEGECQPWNSADNCSRQIALSESVSALNSEAIHWMQKELNIGIALLHLFRYHEDPAFLERQQARCCSPSSSTSNVFHLLNSSSTGESLLPMLTVRHSKAYEGPSRTKDRSCSQ